MRWRHGAEPLARVLGPVTGLVGIAALAWYLVASVRAGDFALQPLAWMPVLAAFALLAAGYAAHATAWHWLHGGYGGTLRWRDDAARWSVSLLGKYLPGKVFHALGRLYLYRRERNEARVTAAFAAEFIVGMTAAATAALAGLALSPIDVPPAARGALWVGVAAGLAGTFSGLPDRLVARLAARLTRRPAFKGRAGAARAGPFALSVAAYVLMGAGLQALASAFEPTPLHLLPAFVAAFCFAGLAGVMAFFVPAGLGVRDVALAWLLSFVMTAPLAASVALAARCWLTLGDLVAIGAGMALNRGARSDGPHAVAGADDPS